MATITEIDDLSLPELLPYSCTSEIQLLHYYEPQPGLFIAESPKVIRRALDAGYEPVSLLMERKYIGGQGSDIIERCGDITVYTAPGELLTELTGFKLTQGALCAMRRRIPDAPEKVLSGAKRVAVLEDIMNQTNVGAIFRSAAALGFDAVVLTHASSDPLYRRSIRVSMGTVFQVKWTFLESARADIDMLHKNGFACAAMALRSESVNIDDRSLKGEEKLAVILGAEGDGLSDETISASDHMTRYVPG
jgi:tRNA G18 (ribose-2'-O)-methylase SpoU